MFLEMLIVSCLLYALGSAHAESQQSPKGFRVAWWESGSGRSCVCVGWLWGGLLRGNGKSSFWKCAFFHLKFHAHLNYKKWLVFGYLISSSNPIFPCFSSLKHISTQTHGERRLQRKELEHQNEHQKPSTPHMAEGAEDGKTLSPRTFPWWQYFSQTGTLAVLFLSSGFTPSVASHLPCATAPAHTREEWNESDLS